MVLQAIQEFETVQMMWKIRISVCSCQKKIWTYRNEKTRKKVCEANLLYFNIARIQQILLQVYWNFSLTCSRMVASYSSYPESSVSNQLFLKKTTNTNRKKWSAQVSRPIEDSFRKELQQKVQTDNRFPCQILDRIYKENDAVFE